MTDDPITVCLEMIERPRTTPSRPAAAGMLLRLADPSTRFVRYLGDAAGAGGGSAAHRDLPDDDLADLLADPQVDLFVLYVGGEPAGWFELDARRDREVELVGFGLMPEHAGRQLDTYLLAAAVDAAWDHEPERVWAMVDTSAHPRALLVYQRAGFTVSDTQPDRGRGADEGS